MCERMPCRPTVSEALVLLEQGYARRLMLRHGVLMPAYVGDEGREATQWRKPCTFLTEDKKCAIQHLKPLEGRAACCKHDSLEPFTTINREWEAHPDAPTIIDLWDEECSSSSSV